LGYITPEDGRQAGSDSLQTVPLPGTAARLTRPPARWIINLHSSNRTMGKQYNKVIKQKRRAAYLKRKKAAAKAAKKK
jgi:hypothetical protein